MGTFIHKIGRLTIPEEKRVEFLSEARKIADQSGLFATNYVCLFDKKLQLLNFPSFEEVDKDGVIDFTYNYFEDSCWENAGIHLKDCTPYSEKIGWKHFNLAVQTIYILAETYSSTPFASFNDSLNAPIATISWLRYLLQRDIQYTWRKHLWTLFELHAKVAAKYSEEPVIDKEFADTFAADNTNLAEWLSVMAVTQGIKSVLPDNTEKKEESVYKMNYLDFIAALHNGVNEYKTTATIKKEEQLQFLLNLLTCEQPERKQLLSDMKNHNLLVGITIVKPQIVVKVISEVYEQNFWKLWWKISDHISIEPVDFFKDNRELEEKANLTTDQFFNIDKDERLYWWVDNGDVEISEAMKEELNSYAERHQKLSSQEDKLTPNQADILKWQKRLVTMLADYPKVMMFDTLFSELIGNFYKKEYRAAVLLLEENVQDSIKYKHLIAALPNTKLRNKVFGF